MNKCCPEETGVNSLAKHRTCDLELKQTEKKAARLRRAALESVDADGDQTPSAGNITLKL
jgi:hypothetical protein